MLKQKKLAVIRRRFKSDNGSLAGFRFGQTNWFSSCKLAFSRLKVYGVFKNLVKKEFIIASGKNYFINIDFSRKVSLFD